MNHGPRTATCGDALAALACAVAAAALYCLKIGLARGDVLQALFLSMFALPVALGIAVFVELPLVFLLRRWRRTGVLEYMLAPGLTVLMLGMASVLSGVGTFSVLKAHGRDLFLDGHIVWGNVGWIAVDPEYAEPAWWASLAGLAFWAIRVRHRGD